MALRVLLADESSTIKKVMQLALQDFAVEVKAVPIGLDVLQVARNFHPDIVFADVLLAKKNGYDVSAEIKADSNLKDVPVVLMWSGFMELDEAKAKFSKADRRLEKPFDAETLRSLVTDLVPGTSGNLISQFLTFPQLPSMIEDGKKSPAETPLAKQHTPLKSPPPKLEEIEEPEEFQSVPLPKELAKAPAKKAPTPAKSEDWARQDLSRFRIELPKDDDFNVSDADLENTSIALSSGLEEVALDDIDNPTPQPLPKASKAPSPHFGEYTGTNLNGIPPSQIEDSLRREARAAIETIAWKILPEIVERVVREELQKLLKDAERL